MNDSLLIKTKEIGNYRIKIYYDTDAECPVTNWDLCGRYLFEYSDRYHSRLHRDCNWSDWFCDRNHSLEDALRRMVCNMVDQKDIISYYKSGKADGFRFVYNRISRQWELQSKYMHKGEERWCVDFEIDPSDLKVYDYRDELVENLERDDLIALIRDCAKDIVIKEWSSAGYCQGDCLHGIGYVTKKRYDEMCGRTDVDWRSFALELIDGEAEEIGIWAWGDVKGFVLEKKLPYTKQYHDGKREDEECFEWEEVDSCFGYYMGTDELIKEVMFEYGLKEVA